MNASFLHRNSAWLGTSALTSSIPKKVLRVCWGTSPSRPAAGPAHLSSRSLRRLVLSLQAITALLIWASQFRKLILNLKSFNEMNHPSRFWTLNCLCSGAAWLISTDHLQLGASPESTWGFPGRPQCRTNHTAVTNFQPPASVWLWNSAADKVFWLHTLLQGGGHSHLPVSRIALAGRQTGVH